MSQYNYEPEEFARARYWQNRCMELEQKLQQKVEDSEHRNMKFFRSEAEKVEYRLERAFHDKIRALTERVNELEIRLKDHREEMEIFNIMPWYERMFHKFDLDNM